MKPVLAALVALGLAGVARAQGPVAPPPREELYKMVDAYIVSNLQESLALSDEQFVKILPLIKKLQNDRRGYLQRRAMLLGEMRRMLESGTATEARIAELMKDLKAREAEEPGIIRKDLEAIDAQLSSLQQAKLRILEVRVEQKLRELVSRVRPQGETRPRPRRDDLPREAP